MWLIIVEAFIALGMLCFIVWWTMFHGRRQGEQLQARAAPPEALEHAPERPLDHALTDPLTNRSGLSDLPDVPAAPPAPSASAPSKPS